MLDFQQRRLLLDAGFIRAEAYVQVRSGGTPETVRSLGESFVRATTDASSPFRRAVVEQGWADAATVEARTAEWHAWPERADSFGCWIWCAAVGWVDG